MESDLYNIDYEPEDAKIYVVPTKIKVYKYRKKNNVYIIPITNITADIKVLTRKYYLDNKYDFSDNIYKNLKKIYFKIKENEFVNPIKIIDKYNISTPSANNSLRNNITAIDTIAITHKQLVNEKIYEPKTDIDKDTLAVCLHYKYKYVPIQIT